MARPWKVPCAVLVDVTHAVWPASVTWGGAYSVATARAKAIRAEHAIADKAALDDLKILNDQAVRNQADLNEARNTIIEKTKETKHEKDAYTDMRDKYLDGSRRLSIVTAASARDKAERDHNSSATVKFTETRTDILPETAGRIFSIARGNYQDVRDLNECIDLYNAARDAVNKKEQ